jgi:aminobenzoyl-glutamate utilization protein B
MAKQDLFKYLDENRKAYSDISRDIWEHPETALREKHASELHAAFLEKNGFRVTLGLKGLPTAVMAEYGEGRPVIGILGEYDALEGLSQADEPVRRPLTEGGPGHGCGHNLLGTGAMAAAAAVAKAIQAGEIRGTVRYYGCPAEEQLIGKTFMLRDGYFDDLDAALYWHPSSNNAPWKGSTLACISAVFTFRGIPAHAPQAQLGRSALDAVEIMDVGANYLREHLPRSVMLHYSVLGNHIPPNTVPDICSVWYMMRSPKRAELDAAFARLQDCAKGAAIITGTKLEKTEIIGSADDVNVSSSLGEIITDNMRECGGPRFSEEDYDYSRRLSSLFSEDELVRGAKAFDVPDEDIHNVLETGIHPMDEGHVQPMSVDLDVSWLVPTGGLNAATWPIGVFTHTWQAAACTGKSVGVSGMMFAAKTLTGTAYDLMSKPELMDKVRDEFRRTSSSRKYRMPLDPDSVPHTVE